MVSRLLRHLFRRDGSSAARAPHSRTRTHSVRSTRRATPTRSDIDTPGGLEGVREALREAFTPSRPQRGGKRLVGRRPQLARILRALVEERSHVVLYAERGRGKTSLANLVAETLRGAGHMVARYACAADSDFDSIIRGLARDLPGPLLATPAVPIDGLEGCEAALPHGHVQPRDVVALPSRLTGRQLVLMVDEFDRILDGATRTRLADTIKQVSDRGVPLAFVIIGVSDSLDQLLGRHPSIQRNVAGVPLPLLTTAEIETILERGAAEAGLHFSPLVREAIAILARGVPYIAQLLALRAGQAALERGTVEVVGHDIDAAIARAVEEADPRVVALYESLTARGRDQDVVAALRSMAFGQLDEFGRFRVEVEPGGDESVLSVAGAPVATALFTRLVEAEVVRACAGGTPDLFTFNDAMLPHYVLLRALREDGRPIGAEEPWPAAAAEHELQGEGGSDRAVATG
jgi:Cdc6-like AAA superfamily ATPase